MNYEDALKEWGARKLQQVYYGEKKLSIVRKSVRVDLDFKEGYACCGGRDPDCYCSFAESPSAHVRIEGRNADGKRYIHDIDHWSFDFATVLREIIDAAGGTVTNENV